MSAFGRARTDAPRLLLDLQALAHNWRLARQASPRTCLGAVLKNQAYGLGLEHTVPTLWSLGCRDFWVGNVDEAWQVQAHLPQPQVCRLHVLNGLGGLAPRDWAQQAWIPVLSGPHELPALLDAPATEAAPLPVAVHLDTGLTRVGFTARDLPWLTPGSALWRQAQPHLWVTQLGRFHDPAAPQCLAQRACFERWTRQLPAAGRSIATSSSLFAGPDWQFEHARIGSALWGVSTSAQQPALRPVASLQAPILRVCEVPAGTEIGYGGRYTTPTARRIATVAVGYGDGLPFSLANRGQLMLLGRPAPIVGGVAMNMLALDVSDYAPGQVQPGQWAEVYGRQQPVETLAAAAGVAPNALLALSAGLARQRLLEPLP